MERKVYNAAVIGSRYEKSGNYLSVKPSGYLLFSKDFSKEIKGKKINIVQDENRPKDWYIEPTDDAAGIPLKEFKKLGGRLSIQSSVITRAIMESLGLTGHHLIMISSDSSDGMWALLTKTAAPIVRGGGQNQE